MILQNIQSCSYCGKLARYDAEDEKGVLKFIAMGFSASGVRPDVYSCRIPCPPQQKAAARRAHLARQQPRLWRR